jgi:diphosphomevalonate decarboxylase
MNSLINNAYIEYTSPSNIAFVKYWGKRDNQIPQNPSLSMTLKNCFSQMSIEFSKSDKYSLDSFLFDGLSNQEFKKKIDSKIRSMLSELPFLNSYSLNIKSQNSFPHSSGIASSASAFSALMLCLLKMESKVLGTELDLKRTSSFSRLCSGSASRSVYSGFSHWGKSFFDHSSDTYAIGIQYEIDLYDSIAIVSSEEKSVSSSLGHKLMDSNPYRETRYQQAHSNIKLLHTALKNKDYHSFGEILEQEAMELHALMMCSKPSFVLLESNSFKIIDEVRRFRRLTGKPLYFTIDAGPNIHLIYPEFILVEVHEFIEKAITPLSQKIIHDVKGTGPELLEERYEFSNE